MTKKITTIKDLAKIAGAELGTKQTESALERRAAEDGPTKPAKPIPAKPAKPPKDPSKPKKPAKPSKPRKPKKTDTEGDHPRYNAFVTRTVDQGPCGLTNIDDAIAEPNPLNGHTRSLKKKALPKLIKEGKTRAEKFKVIYERGVKAGDNDVGYVWVYVGILRDVDRMEKWLVELEEKA